MVDSIIMAQEVTPGDNTKSFICGIINLRGEIIPVISLRRRFSLPDRDILSENFFTILAFKHLKIAIIADMIFGRRTRIADMNCARMRHSLIVANGKLYAIGGE